MPRATVEATAPSSERAVVPEKLRPYLAHGLDLRWRDGAKEASAGCPWCGREGKFNVNVETGQWHCFVCHEGTARGGGNVLTFLRKLWERSDEATNGETDALAEDRGLLWGDTLTHWGVVKSVLTGHWLVPGYGPDGGLCQLYKRIRTAERWELRPTPTLPHGLHGVPLFDGGKPVVWLHESWGNALAFWEAARGTKRLGDGGFAVTGSDASSVLADASVLAVANCGAVGEPLHRFLPLFAGKEVVLAFDSDHPREANGRIVEGAGLSAVKRAVKILASAKEPPAEVAWIRWGADGYDPDKPSGWDVRDFINAS